MSSYGDPSLCVCGSVSARVTDNHGLTPKLRHCEVSVYRGACVGGLALECGCFAVYQVRHETWSWQSLVFCGASVDLCTCMVGSLGTLFSLVFFIRPSLPLPH